MPNEEPQQPIPTTPGGVHVLYLDEIHRLYVQESEYSTKQRVWQQAVADHCARMRDPDLPPAQPHQVEFRARCSHCGDVHRFRVGIFQDAAHLRPAELPAAVRDFFTPMERSKAVKDLNAAFESRSSGAAESTDSMFRNRHDYRDGE